MFKTKTLHLKTKTFLWCILEADRKAFFIFGRKRKCERKWNSIYGRNLNENENGHSFSAKNENESHLIILVFCVIFFSYIQSPKSALQCAANTSSSFAFFCRWSLLTGFRFPHVLWIDLCVIFLDDISIREQFAFLVYCHSVKAVFHTLCTVLYWRLCGLTNSPHC